MATVDTARPTAGVLVDLVVLLVQETLQRGGGKQSANGGHVPPHRQIRGTKTCFLGQGPWEKLQTAKKKNR